MGGFTAVGLRLGGLLVAACDKEQSLRAAYGAHLKELKVELDNAYHLNFMKDLANAALRPIDIICAGPPCQPFSFANTIASGSVWAMQGGDGLSQITEALHTRKHKHGVEDKALLLENVVGMLGHLTDDMLAPLRNVRRSPSPPQPIRAAITHCSHPCTLHALQQEGFHLKVFQAPATIFGCATTRPRIAIIAFRDAEALARFGNGPRPTHTDAGTPLSSVLNSAFNDTNNSPPFLWLRHKTTGGVSYMSEASLASSQVVSPATTEVMVVRTKSNAAYSPQGNGGTWVCVHDDVATQTQRLSQEQLEEWKGWFASNPEREPIYRQLHPTEEMRAMSWRDDEMPPIVKGCLNRASSSSAYAAISECLCPSQFEPFAARMLWAMGKELPLGKVVPDEALPIHFETKRHEKSGLQYIQLHGLQRLAPALPVPPLQNASTTRHFV